MPYCFPFPSNSTFSLAAAILVALGGAKASGELWVYEGFQYAADSELKYNMEDPDDPSPSLSIGFVGGWNLGDPVSGGTVRDEGLTYGSLITHGRSLRNSAGARSEVLNVRTLADVNLFGVSEIWMSFLVQRNHELVDPTDFGTLQLKTPRVGSTLASNLTLGDVGLAEENLGFNYRAVNITTNSEPVNDALVPLGVGQTKLVVFKLSLNVSPVKDVAEMFVNPLIGQSTPGIDPIAAIDIDFQRWFKTAEFNSGYQNSEYIFDELRIGSTYADVTPTPEPTAGLLIGTGAVLAWSRRRRKAA